jgi:hypothetical protein
MACIIDMYGAIDTSNKAVYNELTMDHARQEAADVHSAVKRNGTLICVKQRKQQTYFGETVIRMSRT